MRTGSHLPRPPILSWSRCLCLPTLDDIELRWVNNYCRGLKLGSGSPIHYRSIGQNVEHVIRSGPHSPDCGWFCLAVPQTSEGLVGGWEWSSPMAVSFGDLSASCLIRRPHPHGWDAIEFWDADKGEGIVYVFRNGCAANVQPVVLEGLEPDGSYELSFVDGRVSKTVNGQAFLTQGVPVELLEEMSSEIITIRHVDR